MKFLLMISLVLSSVLYAGAQQDSKGGGLKVDKTGISAKGKKGGEAHIGKGGAAAKGSKGKGVEADKKGTRTTPKK